MISFCEWDDIFRGLSGGSCRFSGVLPQGILKAEETAGEDGILQPAPLTAWNDPDEGRENPSGNQPEAL